MQNETLPQRHPVTREKTTHPADGSPRWQVSGRHGRVVYDVLGNHLAVIDEHGDIDSVMGKTLARVGEYAQLGDNDALFAAITNVYRTLLAGDAEDPRQVAWQIVINGIAGGLPIPTSINIPTSHHIFELKMPDNDPDSVEAWAAHLGLSAPLLGERLSGPRRAFRSYAAETWEYPALPGWKVEVDSYIDEPAEGGVS